MSFLLNAGMGSICAISTHTSLKMEWQEFILLNSEQQRQASNHLLDLISEDISIKTKSLSSLLIPWCCLRKTEADVLGRASVSKFVSSQTAMNICL